MTGEPDMSTAVVRREQLAGERAVSAAGAAELRRMVLMSVASDHSKRNYAKALDEIFALCELRQQPFSRALLMEYRAMMLEKNLSASTTNVRLSGVRKLIGEARRNCILDAEQAAQMADVPNLRQKGSRMGNWRRASRRKNCLRCRTDRRSKASAITAFWRSWSDVRCDAESSPRSSSKTFSNVRAGGSSWTCKVRAAGSERSRYRFG